MPKHITSLKNNVLLALLVFSTPWVAQAVPISSDVSISGSIAYDSTNSSGLGTTQAGSISSTIGGSTTTSTISGTTITGANPLSGALTDIGDGFGSSFTMRGGQNGDEGRLISDYLFNLTNNSTTDQYQITFDISFLNLANADGTDAFVDSQISLIDDATLAELFFSDLTSDVLFGDKKNGTNLPSFGASLSDSGTVMLDFLLDPLASIDLSALSDLEGGIFDSRSAFNGELTSTISLASVVNLTNTPSPVPEPSTLLLLSLSLIGLFITRRK